jgi:hypothetical protein
MNPPNNRLCTYCGCAITMRSRDYPDLCFPCGNRKLNQEQERHEYSRPFLFLVDSLAIKDII